MLSTGIRKISIASILILFLQLCVLPSQVFAAEDSKTKVNRLVAYLDKSNRLNDQWLSSLETLDAIWSALDDANAEKDFAALPRLEKRLSDARKNLTVQNVTLQELLAAESTECQKPGGGSSSDSDVEDACAEFNDANRAVVDAKKMGEEVLVQIDSKLATLSKAAAAAKSPAEKEPTPKATVKPTPKATDKPTPTPTPTPKATVKPTPKATIKVTVNKVICRKGSTAKSFDAKACPYGWVKK